MQSQRNYMRSLHVYQLLYAHYQHYGVDIPRDIEAQADFWKQYYRHTGDVDYFIEASSELEQGCSKSLGVDMVFVLDDSGSVDISSFEMIKNFTRDVIKRFDIGHVRVFIFHNNDFELKFLKIVAESWLIITPLATYYFVGCAPPLASVSFCWGRGYMGVTR